MTPIGLLGLAILVFLGGGGATIWGWRASSEIIRKFDPRPNRKIRFQWDVARAFEEASQAYEKVKGSRARITLIYIASYGGMVALMAGFAMAIRARDLMGLHL